MASMAFNRMEELEGKSPSCLASFHAIFAGRGCGLLSVFGKKKKSESPNKQEKGPLFNYAKMRSSLSSPAEAAADASQEVIGQKAVFAFTEPTPELPCSQREGHVQETLVFRSGAAATAPSTKRCLTPAELAIESPLVLPEVREPAVHNTKRNLLPELSCPPPAKKMTSAGCRFPLAALSVDEVAARALCPGKDYPLSGELDVENCPTMRTQKALARRSRDVNAAPVMGPAKPIKRKPMPQQAVGTKKMKKLFPSAPIAKSCGTQARQMNLAFSDPFDRSTPFFIFADPDF